MAAGELQISTSNGARGLGVRENWTIRRRYAMSQMWGFSQPRVSAILHTAVIDLRVS